MSGAIPSGSSLAAGTSVWQQGPTRSGSRPKGLLHHTQMQYVCRMVPGK